MTYILFSAKPGDGALLTFQFVPSADPEYHPAVGEYVAFDDRDHGLPAAKGCHAYRVRQVFHWHGGGSAMPLVKADPVEIDEPAPFFANTLSAFSAAGGKVDADDRIPADVIRFLLKEAPP